MAVNSATANTAPQITGAIRQAAKSSGISFEYLVTTAKIESNLNPAAQASTSSARGLYQFIDQTWLGTLKTGGAASGYGRFADAISKSSDGRYEVADPAMRTAIMQLRSDPAASAAMAGAFTRANADQIQSSIGRPATEGELYIAHFLGPDGASRLIGAAATNPQAKAADMFPQAAAANSTIFYDSAGRARSAGEVYAKLAGKFETARAFSFSADPLTVASIGPSRASTPDTAGVTEAYATAHESLPALPDSRPLFQAMFTDRARAAVTQTVSGLWTPSKTQSQPQPAAQPGRPLDLFTDTPTVGRKIFGGNPS